MTLRPLLPVLALACLASAAQAHDNLRLPWVFSDEPDLCADFAFAPAEDGKTSIEISLGGRFANFGLPSDAKRPPQLDITCEFAAPSELEHSAVVLRAALDLADVLKEYGLPFSRARFGGSSPLVYKSELRTALDPADYNVRIDVKDAGLGMESRRTLHLIVPEMDGRQWQVGDLKFITAAGERLDEQGRAQRVLDPNPWRQVGGEGGGDLLVAYTDYGPRPAGPLTRSHRIRRLRGDQSVLWQESGPAPAKKPGQIWLVRVPERTLKRWKGSVYVLEVEETCGGRSVRASKTFEVLP